MTALRSLAAEPRAAYQFRAMSSADLPMVRAWLMQAHVRQWWGDPAEQFGLVSEDLGEPAMDQFIVATAGRPFAYLQCYWQTRWAEVNGLGTHPRERAASISSSASRICRIADMALHLFANLSKVYLPPAHRA